MQEEEDEFDIYYTDIDAEHLPCFIDLPPSANGTPSQSPHTKVITQSSPHVPKSPKSAVSDEFSGYDFSEFNAEELDSIELLRPANNGDPGFAQDLDSTGPGGPAVEIEIGQVADADHISSLQHHERGQGELSSTTSPFKEFRSVMSTLSVTDLVGPAWCEYQFDYGLRQGRSRRPDARPSTFTTAQGNEIKVDTSLAKANDKIAQSGKSIHKVLERELHPEAVIVEVGSVEERWALRITNMMASMDYLLTVGRCREMPVFGLVHDQIVVGIIDEVTRRPISPTPASPDNSVKRHRTAESLPNTPSKPKLKRTKTEILASQPTIDSLMLSSPRRRTPPTTKEPSQPTFRLHISDTKTRKYPSLPSDEDTLSARLQLMLYRRLLSDLLAPPTATHAVDLRKIWIRLGLSLTAHFSATFQKETGLPAEVNCLEKLALYWHNCVETLGVDGVDATLAVEYRSQPRSGRRKFKRRSEPGALSPSDQEAADIAAAIAASLQDVSSQGEALEASPPVSTPGSQEGLAAGDATILKKPSEPTFLTSSTKRDSDSDALQPESTSGNNLATKEVDESSRGVLIGTKQFQYDGALLDEYVVDVLKWWYGQRAPRGVDVALTKRCFTCEYMEGCEWREQKALEALQKSKWMRK